MQSLREAAPERQASMTTPREWVERAALCLYEAKRLEEPELELPEFYSGDGDVRRECKYRAEAAYQLLKSSVRGIVIQRIAMTLALADRYIWPECDNKQESPVVVARRRQGFIHRARLIFSEFTQYTEIQAKHEHDVWRDSTLKAARQLAQQDRDTVAQAEAMEPGGRS